MRVKLLLSLGVFALVLAGCNVPTPSELEEEEVEEVDGVASGEEVGVAGDMEYDLEAVLVDVTDGEDLYGGLNTGGEAVGAAYAGFADGEYMLMAEFENLPAPAEDSFYEGWVVRQSPLSVVSTGVVEEVDGVFVNEFASDIDLTDHGTYVLTIEPDDGDPAPAEHVLDGEFEEVI